jgi:hypothetical protein
LSDYIGTVDKVLDCIQKLMEQHKKEEADTLSSKLKDCVDAFAEARKGDVVSL